MTEDYVFYAFCPFTTHTTLNTEENQPSKYQRTILSEYYVSILRQSIMTKYYVSILRQSIMTK